MLKFVKYVSGKAKGDRYDFSGAVEVEDMDDDEDPPVKMFNAGMRADITCTTSY